MSPNTLSCVPLPFCPSAPHLLSVVVIHTATFRETPTCAWDKNGVVAASTMAVGAKLLNKMKINKSRRMSAEVTASATAGPARGKTCWHQPRGKG